MSEVRPCLVCRYENSINAATCENCGAPLRVGKTMRLDNQQVEEVVHDKIEHRTKLLPGTLAFYLLGRSEPIVVEGHQEVTLGRYTPGLTPPTIDLTKYHAGLLGVSRLHAIIRPYGKGYAIEDLGSTNGSWVNENPIRPNQLIALRSGDQVRLGQLIMFVSFLV